MPIIASYLRLSPLKDEVICEEAALQDALEDLMTLPGYGIIKI